MTADVVDVSDQLKCTKAEQRGSDVLILCKLDAPVRRVDGKRARYILEYRWLNNVRDICSAQGNEFSYWLPSEIKGWRDKSLFDIFQLFP